MINWLGQTLAVGDIVYKARRSGNTTNQMVGRILSINEDKFTASVEWWAEPGSRYGYDSNTRTRFKLPDQDMYAKIKNPLAEYSWNRPSTGINDLDSLIKIEDCPLLDKLREDVLH